MARATMITILLALCLATQIRCSPPPQSVATPGATPAPPALPIATPAPEPAAVATMPAPPLPAATATPATPAEYIIAAAPPPPLSPLPIEELIILADAVARVRLTEITEGVEESPLYQAWNGPSPYIGVAVFELEVIEWLKGGDGSASVSGVAVISNGLSSQEASVNAKRYWENRDKRWDNREAIVFMDNSRENVPSTQRPDRYYLGFQTWTGEASYELDSERSWLPLAHDAQAAGASGELEFLLEDPDGRVSGAAGSTQSEAKTLTLTNLNLMLGLSPRELQKRVDSQIGYLEINSSIPPETGLASFDALTQVNEGIRLIWGISGSAPNVTGYRILRRKQTDSEFIELANIPITEEGYYQDMRDILPETKYIYRLRAYGASGDIADARIAITTVAALEPLSGGTATSTPTASPTPQQPTATVAPTATPTNTPATAPTTTPTPAPTLTPTPPAGGVSGAIDTPTPTPTSTPTATATHTPTIAPTATLESSSGGVTGQ